MIRKLELKDKETFIEMSNLFYKSIAVIKPTKPRYLNRTLKEIVADSPYIEGYVYEYDNHIAGYMLLTFTYSNELGGNVTTIDELYVKDEFQGCGIGTEMLKFVEKAYEDQKAITLLVNEKNIPAKTLYEKKGYEEVEYLQMIKSNISDNIIK